MKTHKIFLAFFFAITFCNILSAQISQVIYSSDSLSGELQVRKADLDTNQTYVWTIPMPINSSVRITRINNVYINTPNLYVFENDTRQILDFSTIGEFTDVITDASALTFVLDGTNLSVDADPAVIIRFAKISNIGSNETIIHGGDLELSNGILRAKGSELFKGSKIAALLGGDYASYTCFGALNGGRIRGSNSGYLILEGNPNGYEAPTIYMNRYVSGGNIIMTSPSGKVGMGVDDPKEKLHLGGAIRGNGTEGSLRIKTTHGTLELGAQTDSTVNFSTTISKFIFNQKMEVQGGILATEVKIKSIEDFPDFVFQSDYTLRPLNEVNLFIKQNGHLPEMPSATQVKEEGVDLVEMQKLLLQKIEELTLYTIRQQEEIRHLQAEVEHLKK